jgi:hypothetical protein
MGETFFGTPRLFPIPYLLAFHSSLVFLGMFFRFPCWFGAGYGSTGYVSFFLPFASTRTKREFGYATSTCFSAESERTASLTIDMGQLYSESVVTFRSADGVFFLLLLRSRLRHIWRRKKQLFLLLRCNISGGQHMVSTAALQLPEVMLVASQLFRRISSIQ